MRLRHTLVRWTAGGAFVGLGFVRDAGANFPTLASVLLVLGAFLALALSRAPQRS